MNAAPACCFIWAVLPALLVAAAPAPSERHFLEKVEPLLQSRCVSCHGPDKHKGGLRLDTRAAILKGGDSGAGVVPGNPGKSLVLQAVMHTRAELEMPPKEKLTPGDIAILEKWIRDGAPWPETAAAAQPGTAPKEHLGDAWSDRRNPIVRLFGGQRLDLWSLRPIERPGLPKVRNGGWIRNPIDAFVLSRLEGAGLAPAREADRRTLIRRLTFDLTGMPPTPEEVRAFAGDASSDAYEKVVDRLLASPRYGEQQARQWLDVVRYSDSNGFDWDEFRPSAWRFRDYVIRSFNADKPFDRFVCEQLAGDELVAGPPRDAAEQDCLIATGYLRLGPHDNSAPLFNEQARSRAELMVDLVETTSSAFLGLTLGCCRCHDHKYDPFSQADHYRFRAFFEGVRFADDLPLDLASEQKAISGHNGPIEAQIKSLQQELSKLKADQKTQKESLSKRVAALKKQILPFTHGLLMTDGGKKVPATHILYQGDYRQERGTVEPGFISILDPNPAVISRAPNSSTTGRRLALARWIVSRQNPLTARVMVNRVWQGHFGRGLVATPNDFGLSGARPTHRELLDYLASRFMDEGWSLKRLHRLIVTSAAYRQSSAVSPDAQRRDAENLLLSHQPLRRLSAEELRDSLLLVSGLLKEREGGPPVWPELPPEILQANPAFLDDNAEKTKGWYPSPPQERNVRSIYLVQKRTVQVPFMETFDQPGNSTSCPRRIASTVAPQALTLMNSPMAIEASGAFASRVEKIAGADRLAQVRCAFDLAFQRPPDGEEESACLRLLKQRSLAELCRALLNTNEFLYVD